MMEHAIGTTFNFDIPIEEMVPMVSRAGFRRISLAGGNALESGYLQQDIRKRILRTCSQHGVLVDSIHAPFGSRFDISSPDPGIRTTGIELTLRAIDACRMMGCPQLMIHLSDRFGKEELETRISIIEKSMTSIVDYAHKHGIDIAVENLPSAQAAVLFEHILSRFPENRLGMCLDTSHAHLSRTLCDLMRTYGRRITAVHISDNRGEHDDHQLPYEGSIDWDEFARHFARTGYTGTFLLEVEMRESAFQDASIFVTEAYSRSKRLVSMIEKHKLSDAKY
ncbi:MAG: sugar phosphate isomerase/epimerase [candidate division WOR-3 bacterium]|nr:MAG: sugar phosphate isomerase/epimerase [candidate division WOR-3 bacterium]